MKRFLTVVGCVAVVTVASVYAQPAPTMSRGSTDRDDVMTHIDDLESRVARLEARVGREDPTYLDDGPAADRADDPELTGRILRLDGISTVEPEEADSGKIAQLERDIESMEDNARNQSERLKSMRGMNRQGGSYRRGRGGYKSPGTYDQRSGQAKLIASYRKELGEKKRELRELEEQATETKQVVHGHRGDTIITLYTTRDLSGPLGRVDIGEHLKWTGRKSAADSESEEWVVTSITATEAP